MRENSSSKGIRTQNTSFNNSYEKYNKVVISFVDISLPLNAVMLGKEWYCCGRERSPRLLTVGDIQGWLKLWVKCVDLFGVEN